jgi:hypothetical protein
MMRSRGASRIVSVGTDHIVVRDFAHQRLVDAVQLERRLVEDREQQRVGDLVRRLNRRRDVWPSGGREVECVTPELAPGHCCAPKQNCERDFRLRR